jgi:hypothetical protein
MRTIHHLGSPCIISLVNSSAEEKLFSIRKTHQTPKGSSYSEDPKSKSQRRDQLSRDFFWLPVYPYKFWDSTLKQAEATSFQC